MMPSERRPVPSEWWAGCSIVALAFAASVSGIGNGFAYDDRPLILGNPRLHHLAHLGRLWTESYWPPWMGAGLYRPLTTTAFAIEWALGGGAPWVFHLVSILLYGGVSFLVYRLARVVNDRITEGPNSRTAGLPNDRGVERRGGNVAPAWIAGALFAVHPVHVEAVANVVGQSELLAGAAVVGAVLAYTVARRAVASQQPASGSPRSSALFDAVGGSARAALVIVLIAVACLAKEHAVVAPGLLVAAEAFLVADARPIRERWRALRPLALAIAMTVLAYIAVRTHVLGVFSGDRPNVVLEHLTAPARYWTMLGVVGEWARLLWWPVRLSADYAPQQIALYDHFALALVPDVVIVVAAALLFAACIRRWREAAFALAWLGITLVLVSNAVVTTGVLLAERTLFLPSVGAMLIAGAAVAHAAAIVRWRAFPAVARSAIVILLVGAAVRSAVREPVWRSNDSLFAQAPIDAPLSYRAHDVYAGLLFDRGDKVGGEREARIAIKLYPHDPVLYRDLAHEYMQSGLCVPAIPLLRRSIAENGTMQTDSRLLLAECLLAQGDPMQARVELLRGISEGYYPYYGPGYHRLLLSVDSALARAGKEGKAEGATAPSATAPGATSVSARASRHAGGP